MLHWLIGIWVLHSDAWSTVAASPTKHKKIWTMICALCNVTTHTCYTRIIPGSLAHLLAFTALQYYLETSVISKLRNPGGHLFTPASQTYFFLAHSGATMTNSLTSIISTQTPRSVCICKITSWLLRGQLTNSEMIWSSSTWFSGYFNPSRTSLKGYGGDQTKIVKRAWAGEFPMKSNGN